MLNPEFYSLWNYRKDVLLHLMATNEVRVEEFAPIELKLVIHALEKNPKSYSAWHHRCWTIAFGFTSLEEELALCSKYLDLDQRNFHCWDYRRFVVAADVSIFGSLKSDIFPCDKLPAVATPENEFEYTRVKIEQNFSNFSAWHYRTKLLPIVFSDAEKLKLQLERDFLLIRQAFYTEPEDQSSWLYHIWLISTMKNLLNLEEYLSLLRREEKVCLELIEIEPDCRLAQLAVVRVQKEILACDSNAAIRPSLLSSMIQRYERMLQLDPMRTHFYLHQLHSLSA